MFTMALPKQIRPVMRFRFNEERKSVQKVGYETTQRGDVEVRVKNGRYTVHLCTVANEDGYTFMKVPHIKEPLLSRTLNRARRYCACSGRVTKHLKRHKLLWSKRDDRELAEGEYACYSLMCYGTEAESWVLTTFPYATQTPPSKAQRFATVTMAKKAAEEMSKHLEQNGGLM